MATDRSVVVRLVANVSGYTAAMAQAAQATTALQGHVTHMQGAAAQGATSLGQMGSHGQQAAGLLGGLSVAAQAASGNVTHMHGSSQQAAGSVAHLGIQSQQSSGMMHGLAGALSSFGGFASVAQMGALGVAGGIGYAAKAFMDFDHEMASVRANIGATGAEAQKLGDYVRTAGTKFGFSANESAQATDDLAKAGLNTSQVMGGALTSALALAAAGNVSTGESAEMLATSMSMFGIKVENAADAAREYGHASDLIAAGADKSTASVHSLSEGLQNVGGVAHQMGMSMQDTVGVLAEFDQSGLKGAEGGTALKVMLQQLVNPSKEVRGAFERTNVEAFDAQGKFKGMANLAEELKTKLGGMSEQQRNAAMATMFGSHAVQAASILFKDGAEGVNEWSHEVNESGFAAQNAAKKTDSLKGDLNKLEAAASSTAIQLGQAAQGPLRLVAQGMAGIVKAAGPVIATFGTVADGVSKVVSAVSGGLQSDLKGLGKLFNLIGDGAGYVTDRLSSLGGAAGSLGPVSSTVGGISHAFSSLNTPIMGAVAAMVAFRGASALMGDRVSSASSSLRTFMTSTGAMVQTAGNGAVQMGRFGTSIAQIGQHVPVVASMQSAFVNAAAGAERFPRAAGLASASMAGLRGAAGGLMGAMGGPWGLAVAGLGMGLSLLAQHHQKTAQAAAEQKSREAELAGTLDKTTGAVTAATRSTAAKQLEDEGLLKTARELHLSLNDVTDAYLGQPGALGKVNSALDAANEKYKTQSRYTDLNGVSHERSSKKITGFKDKLNDSAGAATRAAEANKRVADATKEAASSAPSAKDAMKNLADAEKAAGKEAKTFDDALNKVNNTFLALSGSEIAVQQAIASAGEAFAKNGRNVDLSTKAGQENVTQLNAVADGMQKKLAAMRADGEGAQEVATKTSEYRAQLSKLATQAGYSGQALDDYVAKALLVPNDIKTMVTLEDTKAVLAMGQIDSKLKSVNGQTLTIKTKDLPKNIVDDLKKVEGAREHANGTITITANEHNVDAMRAALKDVKDKAVLANGTIVNIPAGTNAGAIKQVIERLGAKSVEVNGTRVQINTSAPLANADRDKINKLKGAAVSANGTMVTIDSKAITGPALADLNRLLSAAQNKTVWITTYTQTIPVGIRNPNAAANAASGGVSGLPMRGGATGGAISDLSGMPRFASGGYLGRIGGKPYGWQDGREGGRVRGPGSATSDQVVTMTSRGLVRTANDEHIIAGDEVAGFGGHAGIYRMRQMARAGILPRFASGGSVDDDWTPDMSGIMAYAASLKVDPSAVTEQRKKVADQKTALNKAIRDLRAAQAGVRGKSGAARVKAENAVATAIERQAKAQRDLNDGKAKLSQMSAGARADTTTRFMMGTTSQNGISQRFLDNIERIRKRGFPRLARSLLEQGDSDAQAIAQTLSGGALSRLKSAQAGLDTSDKLADRKSKLLDDLKGISTGEVADQARAQANAQLIAMQAANQRIAWASGPTTARLEARLDVLAQAIRSQPAPIVQASPVKVITQLDSRPIAESTFGHGAREAQWGSVLPGAEGGW